MVRTKSIFTELLKTSKLYRKSGRMKRYTYTLITLLALILIAGCSPKGSYSVLTFFFDGVPKPVSIPTAEDTQAAKTMALASLNMIPTPVSYTHHNPYLNRDCTQCHDNQSSAKLSMPEPGMCYKCHQNFKETFAFVHGPADGGYCSNCHDPHKSVNIYLLKRQGNDICLQCHVIEDVKKNPAHNASAESECMKCHDPHGGATRFVLKQ